MTSISAGCEQYKRSKYGAFSLRPLTRSISNHARLMPILLKAMTSHRTTGCPVYAKERWKPPGGVSLVDPRLFGFSRTWNQGYLRVTSRGPSSSQHTFFGFPRGVFVSEGTFSRTILRMTTCVILSRCCFIRKSCLYLLGLDKPPHHL